MLTRTFPTRPPRQIYFLLQSLRHSASRSYLCRRGYLKLSINCSASGLEGWLVFVFTQLQDLLVDWKRNKTRERIAKSIAKVSIIKINEREKNRMALSSCNHLRCVIQFLAPHTNHCHSIWQQNNLLNPLSLKDFTGFYTKFFFLFAKLTSFSVIL